MNCFMFIKYKVLEKGKNQSEEEEEEGGGITLKKIKVMQSSKLKGIADHADIM